MVDFDRISSLLASRKPGYSLPREFYLDPDIYEFDLTAIFYRSWLQIGFAVEFPVAGSYLALTIGRTPIVVVRDRDGELRGFFNSCRHRGAQICENGAGKSARLVCPYHRWTYDLSGKLVHAGRMGEDFQPSDHSLKPIHVEVVAGTVYVCLADTPPPIDEFRAKFSPLMASHDMTKVKVAAQNTLVEKANWKLVMENARECYHCASGHPELARVFPAEVSGYFSDEEGRMERFTDRMFNSGLATGPVEGVWWQATRFPLREGCFTMTPDGKPIVRPLMNSTDDGNIGSLRWALEPHSFSHAMSDYIFAFMAFPVAPDETIVVSKWLVHEDAVEGVDYDVEALTNLWNVTNLQDRDLAENNQRGVNSIGYEPGPYSVEAESLVRRFVDWYCRTAKDFARNPAFR